jgi:hypothetical protein
MLSFTAREMSNGRVEERNNAVIDEICPFISDPTSRPQWGRPAKSAGAGAGRG